MFTGCGPSSKVMASTILSVWTDEYEMRAPVGGTFGMAEGAFCGRVVGGAGAGVVSTTGVPGFCTAAARSASFGCFSNTEHPVWVLSMMPNQMLMYMRFKITAESRSKGGIGKA